MLTGGPFASAKAGMKHQRIRVLAKLRLRLVPHVTECQLHTASMWCFTCPTTPPSSAPGVSSTSRFAQSCRASRDPLRRLRLEADVFRAPGALRRSVVYHVTHYAASVWCPRCFEYQSLAPSCGASRDGVPVRRRLVHHMVECQSHCTAHDGVPVEPRPRVDSW